MEELPNVSQSSRASRLPVSNGPAIRQQSLPARDRVVSTGSVISTPSKARTPSNSGGDIVSGKSSSFRGKDSQTRIDSTQSSQQLSKELKNLDSIQHRKARPTLSERTKETLSQLPPSPAVRRHSNFFRPENSMRQPSQGNGDSRAGSSHRADISMQPPMRSVSSGPSSSSGYKKDAATSDFQPSNTSRPPRGSNAEPPFKRQSSITSQKKPLSVKSSDISRSIETRSKLPPAGNISSSLGTSPSAKRNAGQKHLTKPESQPVSAKPLRPTSSVSSNFRKPSMPKQTMNPGDNREASANIPQKNISDTITHESPIIKKSRNISASDVEKAKKKKPAPIKSSLALREHIAKARASRPAGTFDSGVGDDAFNQQSDEVTAKGLLRKRIDSARKDGRLNIAVMGLKEIPTEVLNMYDLEVITGQGLSWAESVDLIRLDASNNELDSLGDNIFPDVDPQKLLDDDDVKGSQFCGLETLDLHGNLLKMVPPGLRRLQVLTTLNLVRMNNPTLVSNS